MNTIDPLVRDVDYKCFLITSFLTTLPYTTIRMGIDKREVVKSWP